MPFFQRMRQQKLLSFTLLLVTLGIGILIGTLLNTGVSAHKQTSPVAPDASPLAIPPAVPLTNQFAKLAKRVEPSVVYIESDYISKPSEAQPGGDSNDQGAPGAHHSDPFDLRHFFGAPAPRSFRTEGSGTGFIVDPHGYIITNNHVIEKADRITVRLAHGDTGYRARVVGYDPETDLAVLKIDTKRPLQPIKMGNSNAVEVGDWVIAIGSPFGLQATVTAGIVSAKGRDVGGREFEHFLQTDAAINPGNSGGPLLNIRGEVIGVNTMIATRSGAYEGIGFALPSNMAVRIYNDIIRDGRVVRGSIGIKWTPGPSQIDALEAFGMNHGVIVGAVSPGGPAYKGGMKDDDVILSMNGKLVKNGEALVNEVADAPIGSKVSFLVDRNGKRLNLEVKIAERSVVWKNQLQASGEGPETPPPPAKLGPVKFGILITGVKAKDRQELDIPSKEGVKVISVDPGSFADDIGVEQGDVILSVNRRPVRLPGDMVKLEAKLKPGQAVAFHIVRAQNGGPVRTYLAGKLPQR
ncbi:MAG: trypsin-like peptidase domain-containing protein [Bryobacteraceae bacterium]